MARIGNKLYFSPKYKFTDLDWDDKNKLIKTFKDRVEGFYLTPTKILNNSKYAFAAGVMCVSTIDFLARITIGSDGVGDRIEHWLKRYVTEFNQSDPINRNITLARRFYEEFRNGLVHEGRIKNRGQFSYDYADLIHLEGEIMIVKPNLLLEKIRESFESYMINVEKDTSLFHQFRCALIRDFGDDVAWAKRQ